MRVFGLRSFWLALTLLAAGSTAPALAADTDPIVTHQAGALPPVPAAEPAPLGEAPGPGGPPDGLPNDGKIHGMVSASVGTSGYRQGAVALQGPLPNGGFVVLSVDASQIDYGHGRRDRAVAPAPAPAN